MGKIIEPIGSSLISYILFSTLNNNLGGCSFETKEDGAYVKYTLPGGADPVLKKLGSSTIKSQTISNSSSSRLTFNSLSKISGLKSISMQSMNDVTGSNVNQYRFSFSYSISGNVLNINYGTYGGGFNGGIRYSATAFEIMD